jgi:hypothetical protein
MNSVRRTLERFGIWIVVVILLATNFVWQHDWMFIAIVAVASAGFAVMRPLDRRANRRAQATQPGTDDVRDGPS